MNSIDIEVYQEAKKYFADQVKLNDIEEDAMRFREFQSKRRTSHGNIHQLKLIYHRYITEKKPMEVYIWGVSSFFRQCKDVFRDVKIRAFIDNDRNKNGSSLDGVPVISPESLEDMPVKPIFICSLFKHEIYAQILSELPQFTSLP